jgi:hypothetical protein
MATFYFLGNQQPIFGEPTWSLRTLINWFIENQYGQLTPSGIYPQQTDDVVLLSPCNTTETGPHIPRYKTVSSGVNLNLAIDGSVYITAQTFTFTNTNLNGNEQAISLIGNVILNNADAISLNTEDQYIYILGSLTLNGNSRSENLRRPIVCNDTSSCFDDDDRGFEYTANDYSYIVLTGESNGIVNFYDESSGGSLSNDAICNYYDTSHAIVGASPTESETKGDARFYNNSYLYSSFNGKNITFNDNSYVEFPQNTIKCQNALFNDSTTNSSRIIASGSIDFADSSTNSGVLDANGGVGFGSGGTNSGNVTCQGSFGFFGTTNSGNVTCRDAAFVNLTAINSGSITCSRDFIFNGTRNNGRIIAVNVDFGTSSNNYGIIIAENIAFAPLSTNRAGISCSGSFGFDGTLNLSPIECRTASFSYSGFENTADIICSGDVFFAGISNNKKISGNNITLTNTSFVNTGPITALGRLQFPGSSNSAKIICSTSTFSKTTFSNSGEIICSGNMTFAGNANSGTITSPKIVFNNFNNTGTINSNYLDFYSSNNQSSGTINVTTLIIFHGSSRNYGKVNGPTRLGYLPISVVSLVDWTDYTGLITGEVFDGGGNIFNPTIIYIDSDPVGDICLGTGGKILFYGSSENHYKVRATSVGFYDNSANYGIAVGGSNDDKTDDINSVVSFNDYSSNTADAFSGRLINGAVTLYSVTFFNNYSDNHGLCFNTHFSDASYNYGATAYGFHASVFWPVLRPLDGSYDLITYYNYPLATIFTDAEGDGDWSNLDNWTDLNGSPAYFLPDANSIVTINAPITEASSTGIIVGVATFKTGSYFGSGLTLRGSAVFEGNSYNEGIITRSASFNDTSYNDTTGEIGGDITLENYSYNLGYVDGNAYVIYPSPYPVGGTILGTITYRNYPRSVVFTGAINGDWANLENWKDLYNFKGFILPDINTAVEVQAPITQISSGSAYCSTATFKQNSYWGAGITLRGNAEFTGNSYNAGTIFRNANVYFPSANPIGGTVNGSVNYFGYTRASIFTGAVSGDWANINNWTNSEGTTPFYLPSASTDVTINAAVTSCSSGTIRCKTASFRNSSRLGSGLTLYGNTYFYDLSTNAGTINGDANVYFPAPNPFGGTVTGKITYYNYTQGYIFNNTAKDGDWANILNWVDGLGNQAVILPTSGINVTINAPITQISSGSAYCSTATFNTGSYWGVGLTLRGNALFNKNSYNRGTIMGTAGFSDSSYNQGSVGGSATFSYNSYNIGSVTGNSVFNDLSYNNGTITGNATFNQLESLSGEAIDKNGYANGVVGGISYDKYGNIITTFRFYNTNLLGTVTGNAKVYYPLPIPLGGTVSGTITYIGYQPKIGYGFKNTDGDGDWGNIDNWVYSTDGTTFTLPSALPSSSDNVWIDAPVTQNTAPYAYCADANIYEDFGITLTNSGTAYFGGEAINTGTISGVASFGAASENQGTCSSTTEFNDNSINYGSVNAISNFYFESANNGDLYGTASFYDYSFVDSTGVNHASSYFYNYSFNNGIIASGYFLNFSHNNGSATYGEFNNVSYNNGTISGNAKFNYITISNGYAVDITSYASGNVSGLVQDSAGNTISLWVFNTTNLAGVVKGNALFYQTSICNGLVTGNASFYETSSNTGEISGNAIVYYPVRTPLGGIVRGTITYIGYVEEYDFLTVNISLNPIQDSFSVRI